MRRYIANILAALTRDGIDLDETENAVLDGAPGQTISMRCALADARGALWAHVACAALTLVQFRHCQKQLAGVPMQWWNYCAAVFWLIAIPAAIARLLFLI